MTKPLPLLFTLLLLASAKTLRAADAPATAPSPLADGDFTIAPPYANAPELTRSDDIPKGTIHNFIMKSQDSKFYSGVSKTQPGVVVPYERKVALYIPANYIPGTPSPFLICHDGTSNTNVTAIPAVLDTMIHQKRLPSMIAIFINHGGGDGPGSERGLEYDTVSDKYTQFVESEVLPKIEKDYNVTLTKDPDGRALVGESSGAACAFTMAWFHPELYHRVLSYSGTFVNQAPTPDHPHGAWEYHEKLISNSPAKPLRIWLEAGENDNGYARDEASLHNWLLANQHMAAVLKANGYHYRFVTAQTATHTDHRVILQTLPDALAYIWQGYPIN